MRLSKGCHFDSFSTRELGCRRELQHHRLSGIATEVDVHVDPERAAQGPFGTTIAHGYLTQSLVNLFLPQIIEVRGFKMGMNYGADRVRFPAPVPVGSRVRGRAELIKVEDTKDGAVQAVTRVTVEIEGSDKPGCVIDTISR